MTTFQLETVDQCCEDIQPLLAQHWNEVALYRDEIPLAPDFDRYRAMEAAGGLVLLTARREGQLIGYSVFFVSQHPHYSTCRIASNDVLFLRADCRGPLGIRLIRESERVLSDAGVQRIVWHVKPRNDWSSVLERMGYQHEEIIMGKLIGERHGT